MQRPQPAQIWHLTYTASVTDKCFDDMWSIVHKCSARNKRNGIRGYIIFDPVVRLVHQLLEGPKEMVTRTYNKIQKDPRIIRVQSKKQGLVAEHFTRREGLTIWRHNCSHVPRFIKKKPFLNNSTDFHKKYNLISLPPPNTHGQAFLCGANEQMEMSHAQQNNQLVRCYYPCNDEPPKGKHRRVRPPRTDWPKYFRLYFCEWVAREYILSGSYVVPGVGIQFSDGFWAMSTLAHYNLPKYGRRPRFKVFAITDRRPHYLTKYVEMSVKLLDKLCDRRSRRVSNKISITYGEFRAIEGLCRVRISDVDHNSIEEQIRCGSVLQPRQKDTVQAIRVCKQTTEDLLETAQNRLAFLQGEDYDSENLDSDEGIDPRDEELGPFLIGLPRDSRSLPWIYGTLLEVLSNYIGNVPSDVVGLISQFAGVDQAGTRCPVRDFRRCFPNLAWHNVN